MTNLATLAVAKNIHAITNFRFLEFKMSTDLNPRGRSFVRAMILRTFGFTEQQELA